MTAHEQASPFWASLVKTGLGILRSLVKLDGQQSGLWDEFTQMIEALFP